MLQYLLLPDLALDQTPELLLQSLQIAFGAPVFLEAGLLLALKLLDLRLNFTDFLHLLRTRKLLNLALAVADLLLAARVVLEILHVVAADRDELLERLKDWLELFLHLRQRLLRLLPGGLGAEGLLAAGVELLELGLGDPELLLEAVLLLEVFVQLRG